MDGCEALRFEVVRDGEVLGEGGMWRRWGPYDADVSGEGKTADGEDFADADDDVAEEEELQFSGSGVRILLALGFAESLPSADGGFFPF